MCGIAIQWTTHSCNPDKISHRGISRKTIEFGDYKMTHFKLPFQTEIGDEFDQPIRLHNGNYLLFNGEIFNIPKEFKNDVEYLVDFFSKNGWLDAIGSIEYNQWDGFWAICIVTPDKVYAFTDPLGKKQLYFREGCIASEMKVLLDKNHPLEEERFSFQDIEATNFTPFQGVYRITPNKLYEFQGTISKKIRDNLFDLDELPNDDFLYKIMERSVRSRMINRLDHNTLFVSGGLDSTIILYHLHKLGLLSSFELITIDNNKDSEYISLIEAYFNCSVRRINERELTSEEVHKVVRAYEYPLERGSLFQQFRLVEASTGSVLYSGDGADELFSGYGRALYNDTQDFDVFHELPYYHHIRLDRIGMMFTKEIRSPFLGHEVVRWARNCGYDARKGKLVLRRVYEGKIPQQIIDRSKVPLRDSGMFENREEYINRIRNIFKDEFKHRI